MSHLDSSRSISTRRSIWSRSTLRYRSMALIWGLTGSIESSVYCIYSHSACFFSAAHKVWFVTCICRCYEFWLSSDLSSSLSSRSSKSRWSHRSRGSTVARRTSRSLFTRFSLNTQILLLWDFCNSSSFNEEGTKSFSEWILTLQNHTQLPDSVTSYMNIFGPENVLSLKELMYLFFIKTKNIIKLKRDCS